MNWIQLLNTLIFVFGTFAAVLESIYLSRIWIQKLPEHTRLALEQFARLAVQQVEQQAEQLSNPAKKQLAITSIAHLFQSFGLPIPSDEAINIAIEAAVLLLPKTNGAVESDTTIAQKQISEGK
jgi:LL-H family phage holin